MGSRPRSIADFQFPSRPVGRRVQPQSIRSAAGETRHRRRTYRVRFSTAASRPRLLQSRAQSPVRAQSLPHPDGRGPRRLPTAASHRRRTVASNSYTVHNTESCALEAQNRLN